MIVLARKTGLSLIVVFFSFDNHIQVIMAMFLVAAGRA